MTPTSRWLAPLLVVLSCAPEAAAGPRRGGPDDCVDCANARVKPKPRVATTPPASPDQLPPLFDEMLGHYLAAQAVKDALVVGDTGRAREILVDLGGRQVHPAVPEALRGYATALSAEAATAAAATTRREVADVYTRTLVRCGDCHTAGGITVRDVPWPVPEGDTPSARMRRHDWVADRIWVSLVQGTPVRWVEAMQVLEATPTATEAAAGDPGMLALARRVHALGGQASVAPDAATRAAIAGELYATCGECHAQGGKGP